MKQQHTSPLQPVAVQKVLEGIAAKRFVDATGKNNINLAKIYEGKGWFTAQVNLCLSYISILLSTLHKKIV